MHLLAVLLIEEDADLYLSLFDHKPLPILISSLFLIAMLQDIVKWQLMIVAFMIVVK